MSDELRTLVTGTTERLTIKDKFGNEHVLPALDLADFVEYEDKTGSTLLDAKRDMKIKDVCYLLYLSLRKEGLGREDVENRRWKFNERQILLMFDLKFLKESASVLLDLLKISGLEVAKPVDPLVEVPSQA